MPEDRTKDIENHPEGSGLAGAVGAEESDHLALVDREAQIVDRDKVAEASGYAFEAEHSHISSAFAHLTCRASFVAIRR